MAAVAGMVGVTVAHAAIFNGTVYFTRYSGSPNVSSVAYTYDDVAHAFTLAPEVAITTTNGADGIIFATNGNLLVGGQGSGNVYEVNPTSGALVGTGNAQGGSIFHLSLDPSGSKVYGSDFGGALKTFALAGTNVANATTTAITGSESGLTGVAFDKNGSAYYVQGSPNGFGNVGHIDIASGVTTRVFSSLLPAHGMVYDSFTNLMTLFGAGGVGTFDPLAGSDAAIIASLKTRSQINCDFDQGAVDGKGHALIAGCGGITFIDYSKTGNIADVTNFVSIKDGFGAIDDVAPLSGVGSTPNVPEPETYALMLAGLGVIGLVKRRARRG
jgi:hypothetical protein